MSWEKKWMIIANIIARLKQISIQSNHTNHRILHVRITKKKKNTLPNLLSECFEHNDVKCFITDPILYIAIPS